VLANISPNNGQQGQNSIPVTITGMFTQFSNASQITFGNTGVTASSPVSATATSLTLNVSIAVSAPTGPTNVIVTTGGQAVTLVGGFTVNPGTPAISMVSPNIGQQGQANIPVSVTGAFTQFSNSSVVTFSGTGVTAGPPGNVTTTSLTVSVSIDPAAAPTARDVTVTTSGQAVTLPGGFTVSTFPGPQISLVAPDGAASGASVTVMVQGINLSGSTFLISQSNGSVGSAVINAAGTQATLQLTPGANLGAFNIVATNAQGTSPIAPANQFIILSPHGGSQELLSVLNTATQAGSNSVTARFVSVLNSAAPAGSNSVTHTIRFGAQHCDNGEFELSHNAVRFGAQHSRARGTFVGAKLVGFRAEYNAGRFQPFGALLG